MPYTIYAQVDQIDGVQDYVPNRPCLRLIGIDEDSFARGAFNTGDGCRTYLLDVSWEDFVNAPTEDNPDEPMKWEWPREPYPILDDWPSNWWLKLRLSPASQGKSGSYTYELFVDAEPSYVTLDFKGIQTGAAVAPLPPSQNKPASSANQGYELYAYHVGQGMCALLKGRTEGFLFDAGAGTPVKRPEYQSGHHTPTRLFTNQLSAAIKHLQLQAIISHPDSDHWRLLDWDPALRNSVTAIFTPQGTPALALKSPHILSKVQAIGDAIAYDSAGLQLFKVHRSRPAPPNSSRNSECLVVETTCCGSVILPGDYVYDFWARDSNPGIRSLSTKKVEAVMVPHHGDKASAHVTVQPQSTHSQAFFSAGDHKGYKHPTPSSIAAHKTRGFLTVDKHALDDIIEHPLP